ncbi:MAG TPA: RagB/SusD family nutrient uptake outer membrane protein [Puia sp.]
MSIRNIPITLSCLLGLACVITSAGCRKLLDVAPPQDHVSTGMVFSSDTNALSALTGLYIEMMDNPRGLVNGSLSIYQGLSSDELVNAFPNPNEDAFRTNTLSADNAVCANLYNTAYSLIHVANALLTGLDGSSGVSAATKAEIRGEAEFVRALVYFYLVNDYGPVPLVTTSDYTTSAQLPRASTAQVYQQIVTDLEGAVALLSADYITTSDYAGERTRPNRSTALALLARVRLYMGQWAAADSAASAVIGNPLYRLEPNLDSVFLSSSREAIWQLQPVHGNMATAEGQAFVSGMYILTDKLLNAYEAGDQRKTRWTAKAPSGKYYAYKYKRTSYDPSRKEYDMVIRLGEIYLIRAEARLHEGLVNEASADLNTIRSRAGLAPVTANDSTILHERQVELMTEWGHRWLDLKRSNFATTVLGPIKATWKPTAVLYPLPATELVNNPGLVQNSGY